MGQEIPSYVVAAKAQRDLYYSDTRFQKASEFVIASGFEGIVATQDKQFEDFLSGRYIRHNATLEQLVEMQEPQVVLLGDVFHFSRKFFTTSHDCGEDVQNPVPLIQNVFDALAASDDKHAAKFLEELNDLSSNNTYTQGKIVRVAADILPNLTSNYIESLRSLESKQKIGSTQYNSEKAKLDQKQMALLDKIIEYTKRVIKANQEPSLSNFIKYAGLEKTNVNDEREGLRQITIDYIQELLGIHKGDYGATISEVEREAGALLVVNNHRERNGSGLKLTIGTGSTENPRTSQLVYNRENRGGEAIYGMLMAVCDRILANPQVPTESKTTTSMTRKSIVSYQTRG